MQSLDHIYQFKAALKNVAPPVWRRIQIADTATFWELHVAIQNAMGWEGYHLHCFEFLEKGKRVGIHIGIPDEEIGDWGDEFFCGWRVKLSDWFKKEGDKCRYDYDFGDGWEHVVFLEKISPRDKGTKYPRCIAGKRACPPEDCGEPWGYAELLKIIKDSRHLGYKDMMEWLGAPFDPEAFDCNDVYFDNAQKRLKDMLAHQ